MAETSITVDGEIQSHSDIRRSIWIPTSPEQGCAIQVFVPLGGKWGVLTFRTCSGVRHKTFENAAPVNVPGTSSATTTGNDFFSHWMAYALYNTSFFCTLSTSCLQFSLPVLLSRASLQIVLSWCIIPPWCTAHLLVTSHLSQLSLFLTVI